MSNSKNQNPTFYQDLKNNLFSLMLFMAGLAGFFLGLYSAGKTDDAILGGAIILFVSLVAFIAQYISYKKTYK